MTGGHLGQMIKVFVSSKIRREGISRTAALDVWRADFGLSRRPVERVPWEAALRQSILGMVDISQERSPRGPLVKDLKRT